MSEQRKEKKSKSKAKRPWYKTIFSRDANIFVKMARVLVLAYAGITAVEASLAHVVDGRELHQDEITALEKMGYEGTIDYKDVRIHVSDTSDKLLDMMEMDAATKGNLVLVHSRMYEENFTQAEPYDEGVFVHEIGHVWQYQNAVIWPGLHALKDFFSRHAFDHDGTQAYAYDVEEGKDLLDYGLEQQPSIIADFYLHAKTGEFPAVVENALLDLPEKERAQRRAELVEGYESVLENFLKDPNYARYNAFKPW